MPSEVPDGNLAYLFARKGVPVTVAMSFDILEDAAEIFESVFYADYLSNWNASAAAKRGRQALAQQRKRKAAFKTTVELDDYFVPVVYSAINGTRESSDKNKQRSL
jgi:hypothetical protein